MADRGEILAPGTEPAAGEPAAAGGPAVTSDPATPAVTLPAASRGSVPSSAPSRPGRAKWTGLTADQAQARIGTTLREKWRLDSILGAGGMAVVYAATHRNGTRAAVKVLHSELTINALARERFLWEGQVANAVGHPGAVRVLDDDVADDGSLYLVTELLEGETLEDRRVRLGGRLSEDEVLLAMDQVLDCLAAAHDHKIVHRDLKPDNLFLTGSGQVKLLDFGIARLRQPVAGAPRRLTQAGDAMGTPAFMAPEHARGLWDDVDERSDLWACGASMFHLLSGVVVHDGRTVNEQLLSAMTRPAVPLSCVAPHVSRQVMRIVDKTLSFEKSARWTDARAMRVAIREVYAELHGAPISSALPLTVEGTPADHSLVRRKVSAPPPQPSGAERPVAVSVPSPIRRPKRVGIAAALAGLTIGSGIAFSALRMQGHANVSAPVASPSVVRAALVSPPAASPSVSAPTVLVPPKEPSDGTPVIAATDLPLAPAPPAPVPPKAGAARTPSRADCAVPYAVDPVTGKKHWKLECL
jgi:serine/threonine-protein kinase